MADKNTANGMRSGTAPSKVGAKSEELKPGQKIPDESYLGEGTTLSEDDVARISNPQNPDVKDIYRRDLKKERDTMAEYKEKYGAPKSSQEWEEFHKYVYAPEKSEDMKQEVDEAAGEDVLLTTDKEQAELPGYKYATPEEFAEQTGISTEEQKSGVDTSKKQGTAGEERDEQQQQEEEQEQEEETPSYEEQLLSIQEDMDSEFQAYMDQFGNYTDSISEQSANAIKNIKETFERRRQQTKRVNKAVLNTKKLAGARSGRQRYATDIQSSIISSEERAGIQRLADLDAQEQQLVMQAKQAETDKQWKAYNQLFSAIQQNRQQKMNTVMQLQQMSMAQEEMNLKKLKEAQDQQMEMLNYNLQAERVGMERERLERQEANQEMEQLAESQMVPEAFMPSEKRQYEQRLGLPQGTFDTYFSSLKQAQQQKKLGNEVEFKKSLMDLLGKVPQDTMIEVGGSVYQGAKEKDMYVIRETDAYGNVTVMGINEQTGETEYTKSLGRVGKGTLGGRGGSGAGAPKLPSGVPQDELSSLAMQAIEMEESLGGYNSEKSKKWYQEFTNRLAKTEGAISQDPDIIDTLLRQRMAEIKDKLGKEQGVTVEEEAKEVIEGGGEVQEESYAERGLGTFGTGEGVEGVKNFTEAWWETASDWDKSKYLPKSWVNKGWDEVKEYLFGKKQ